MCFLGIHQWSKWKETSRGDVARYSPDGKVIGISGTYIRQERKCAACDKIELRIVRTEF